MNTPVISDENINKLCRICLNKDNLLINIFTMSSKFEDIIMNAIISCAPVQISENDGLPPSICKTCQKQLEVAHQFQIVALKSDKILRTYLKQKQRNQSNYSLTYSNSECKEELDITDFGNNCPQVPYSQPIVKVEVLSDFTTTSTKFVNENNTEKLSNTDKYNYEAKYLCTVPENSPIKQENNAIKQEINIKLDIETSDSVDDDKTIDDANKPTHTNDVSKTQRDGCLRCEVCDKTFARSVNLRIHERIHTGEKPFKCTVCNEAFISVNRLNYHKRRHDRKKLYKCDICDKVFNRSGDLWMHKRRHADDKPHRCDVCNKSFLRPFDLRAHIVKHTGEKNYQCDICDKFFTRKYTLNVHKKKHLGKKNHQCDMCEKRFVFPFELLAHKRKHTGEKVCQCEICGKGFVNFPALSKHKQIHTEAKPFKCDICNKCFSRNGILKIHSRVHTGEKPYQCDNCGKSFTSYSSFRRHAQKHAEKL